MGHTKANFRGYRDLVGLSQADVARLLDVNVKTVKRWERPGGPYRTIPDDAWDLLEERVSVHDRMLDYVVEKAGGGKRLEPHGPRVVMTYYRDQTDFDEHGRDQGGLAGVANANAVAAANALRAMGYEVVFAYAGDGAVRTPGSNY